ncbi:hypothetical protein C8R46DRAFT_7167 [Mycena filopes]|nr:hypothetical protein C8R46DRAFT_7167 [Mycena filopes]
MRPFSTLFFALVLPAFAAAQTVTTTDAAGETIVENITIDPNGIPTTVILQTIPPVGGAAGAGDAVTTTITTTDPAGETVVEVITGDGEGDSVTNTIQTIVAVDQNPGPVGQPGPTGAAGAPTPFTYTTTNAAGETIPVVATFTPSVATTNPVSATFQATVMDYSAYTASYATLVPAQNANSNSKNNSGFQRSPQWWATSLSVMIGMAGGMLLVLGA